MLLDLEVKRLYLRLMITKLFNLPRHTRLWQAGRQ